MRVVVHAGKLYELLRTVAPSHAIRHGLPPSFGVALATKGRDHLVARGIDPGFQVQATSEAEVLDPGDLVVAPAEPLIQIVGRLAVAGVAEVTLEADMATGSLKVQAAGKGGRYTLHNVRESGVLPVFPEAGPDGVVIQASVLREIARGIASVTELEEKATLPPLAGVHFRIQDGQLMAEATDKVRIARLMAPIQHRPGLQMDFIVPGQALRQAVRALPEEGPVDLYLGSGVVVFEVPGGQMKVTLRLTDGQYPDLGRFIPSEFPVRFRTEAENLAGALARASTFAEKGYVAVTVRVGPSGLGLELQQTERGGGQEVVEGVVTLPDGVEWVNRRFNALLLLEGVQATAGNELVLELAAGDMGLVRVRPLEPGEGGVEYQYLLLPLMGQ